MANHTQTRWYNMSPLIQFGRGYLRGQVLTQVAPKLNFLNLLGTDWYVDCT